MNEMNERLTKSFQTAELLQQDLREILRLATNPGRPEGPSLGDKAVAVIVSDMLSDLHAIRSKLGSICP